MLSRTTKNLLYADILIESNNLLVKLEEELKSERKGVKTSEETKIVNKNLKGCIMNYQRIRNNAIIMLIKGGTYFYTKSEEWRSSKYIFLKVNGIIYSLELQSAKSLLSNESEKVLDKAFSSEEKNNKINLSELDNFNFDDYKCSSQMNKKIPLSTEEGDGSIEFKTIQTEQDTIQSQKKNLHIQNTEEKNTNEMMLPSLKENENFINIQVSDLVMDIYTVLLSDKKSPDTKKTFTIIIAPADVSREEYSSFAPTFAFAKSGEHVCACASPNKLRSSYQIVIDHETFVVRGKWSSEGFVSFVYPQNSNNKNVSIQKKQMKPLSEKNIGHNISEFENGMKFHVLPLSSANSSNGNVGILVCLEDTVEDRYYCSCTKEHTFVEVKNNQISYNVSAKWINKTLVSSIRIK